MKFVLAPEINPELRRIVDRLGLSHIKPEKIVSFKSFGSKGRSVARIWSLPRIWQIALNKEAHYCLELISERFDRLSSSEKEKVLIHELLHIPRNFSGALLPHRHHSRRIDRRTVEKWHAKLYVKWGK